MNLISKTNAVCFDFFEDEILTKDEALKIWVGNAKNKNVSPLLLDSVKFSLQPKKLLI